MTTYGYIRVSSSTQNPERQIRKMCELGVSPSCMFVDYASGKNLDRPHYSELMKVVCDGDLIIVDSLDRLGRSYDDVTSEWRRLVGMGVDIRCLDLEFFDSAKLREMGAIGICVEDMLLSLLAYVAQTEREKNRQRQAEGIAIAKSAGKYKGKPKKSYDAVLLAEAQAVLNLKGKSAASRVLGCHVNTIGNMIADGRLTYGAA